MKKGIGVGMGLDEVSMSAASIPYVKEAIRNSSFENVQAIAARCWRWKLEQK